MSTIYAETTHRDDTSTGAITMPTSRTLQLSPRLATLPNDHVNFSGALLDTDAHLKYLHDLDAILNNIRSSRFWPHQSHAQLVHRTASHRAVRCEMEPAARPRSAPIGPPPFCSAPAKERTI
jgi:hypothetical protein